MKQPKEFSLDELLNPKTPLAEHYAKKLPQKGWAGKLTPTEKEYVRLVKGARKQRTAGSPDINKVP